jgi:hypothetical protein
LRENRASVEGKSPDRSRHDDDVRVRRQLETGGCDMFRKPNAERCGQVLDHAERFARPARVVTEIEHTERARAGQGADEPRIRALERRHPDDARNVGENGGLRRDHGNARTATGDCRRRLLLAGRRFSRKTLLFESSRDKPLPGNQAPAPK